MAAAVAQCVRTKFEGTLWAATSPGRYRHISGLYRDVRADGPGGGQLLAYFPQDVPPDASRTRFYYRTPPGDVTLELRCTLPPAVVAALVARVSSDSISTARGSDQELGRYHGPVDFHLFNVGDVPGSWKLPETYTVYVTGTGHQLENGDQWNYEAGVAVDLATDDVLYWMQSTAGPGPTTR